MSESNKKVIVITGVSKGIGRSIALEFIKRGGWTVIGCARSKSIINEMNNKYKEHYFACVDVSNYEAIKSFSDYIIKNYGVPDILINNAFIPPNEINFEKKSINHYHKHLNVNLFGCLYFIHSLLPFMKKSNKNNIKILNMTSLNGILGSPLRAEYCMAKFGMEGLTKSLALELPNHIMVCAYDPGAVATGMMLKAIKVSKERLHKIGIIDESKWGELNYSLIINDLCRKKHNGEHVYGINSKQSYAAFSKLYSKL